MPASVRRQRRRPLRALQLRWRVFSRLRRFQRAYHDVDVSAEADAVHANPDYIRFIASDPAWLREAFKRLRPTPTDVFLDLGAGKGSALLIAAEEPFARVIGVEIVPRLAAIARINLEHTGRPRRCAEIELVVGDATTYQVPPDTTLAYLFSPFTGRTLARVAANIIESHDANPRPLHVVYACPHGEATLLESGRLKPIERFDVPAPPGVRSDVAIYQVTPAP
jgi:SAM-dependent methyltransferase